MELPDNNTGVNLTNSKFLELHDEVDWEETDFDAIHGVAVDDPSKPLNFYGSLKRYRQVVGSKKALAFVHVWALFSILLHTANPAYTPLKTFGFVAFLYAEYFVLAWVITYRVFPRKPTIQATRHGVRLRALSMEFAPIPWSEIQEIKVVNLCGIKQVAIIARDPDKAASYVRGALFDVWFYSLCFRLEAALRRIGIWLPIASMPESFLPMDAADVVDLLNARLNHFRNESVGLEDSTLGDSRAVLTG